jgi:TRAP-type uncharacterized transport system substrate-binding protein
VDLLMGPHTEDWVQPVITRSRIALEVVSEMMNERSFLPKQAKVTLRKQGSHQPWEFTIFGSDAPPSIDEVVRGEVDLAIVNPALCLTMAYLGKGRWTEPQPVRLLTVIPSTDQFLFAVAKRTGITSLAEIKEKKPPLRVSMRSQPDHADYLIVEQVLAEYGFSLDDIVSWGGSIHTHGFPPRPDRVAAGEIDAIFDEAVNQWGTNAIKADMNLLEIDDAMMKRLEAKGFQRGVMTKAEYPVLERDVQSIDFSGWPVFVREDADPDFVRLFCESLEKRKDRIGWQGSGPLPTERMVIDSEDTPVRVPFHPAAEAYWRDRGYLK